MEKATIEKVKLNSNWLKGISDFLPQISNGKTSNLIKKFISRNIGI